LAQVTRGGGGTKVCSNKGDCPSPIFDIEKNIFTWANVSQVSDVAY
jgi:hypothetical protein